MTHPIALGLMAIVLVLGLAVGFTIHSVRDYDSSGPDSSSISSGKRTSQSGQRFGFIRSVENTDGRVYLSFDEAQFYTGEAAQNAALAAGRCTPETLSECTPNDFYIENTSDELSWRAVDPDVRITMETLRYTDTGSYASGENITLSEFQNLFTETSLWRSIPFWIMVEDGRVTEIQEQYIP